MPSCSTERRRQHTLAGHELRNLPSVRFARLCMVVVAFAFLCTPLAVDAQAEPFVQEEALRLDDLAALLGTFQALTIPIPATAQTLYLAQAQGDDFGGLAGITIPGTSAFTPTRIRLVGGFPRVHNPRCGEASLTFWLRLESEAGSVETESCYSPPAGHSGGRWIALSAGEPLIFEAWTPLWAYVPSVAGQPGTGREPYAYADRESWLLVLLYTGTLPFEGITPPNLHDIRRGLPVP